MSVHTVVTEAPPVLSCAGLTAGYGDLPAVRDVDLQVRAGEIVGLFGPNGAGKSTVLMTLAGVLPTMAGTASVPGRDARRARLHRVARAGVAYIPEGRSVISQLTVQDNLRLASGGSTDALEIFPELEPLLHRRAGLLSGGEQQMLVLARALARRPVALLVDEISLGLAPLVVDQLFARLRAAADQHGLAVLLVEQQMQRALDVVDRWVLLHNGTVRARGERSGGAIPLQLAYADALSGRESGPLPSDDEVPATRPIDLGDHS